MADDKSGGMPRSDANSLSDDATAPGAAGTPPDALVAPDDKLITCGQCGNRVPRLDFCIRCGDPLSDEYNAETKRERRGRFAAAPDESMASVALISTLFPQLPRTEMRTFRLALVLGMVLVAGIALAGFFPVALVVAAVLVPLLMVLYLWVVDIYEDEPLWAIGGSMVWGLVAGVVAGVLLQALPSGSVVGPSRTATLVLAGVGVPLFEAALMLIGPLLLLTHRRFNDVLDGATFGAASAVSFSGAHVLVQALPILGAGLRPTGEPVPLAIQVLSLGVLQPVIAAGAIGAVTAAFWLRYRAPVADRNALGMVGVPMFAVAGGALLLVLAGLAKTLLSLIPATIALALLAVLAVLWLRRALHLGLMQESREVEVGRSISCPNCGRVTPEHTFCGNCGVALRALPKTRAPRVPAANVSRSE